MVLLLPKPSGLLVLLLLIAAMSQCPGTAETRPIELLREQRYSRIFAALGVGCQCCDGERGECRSEWDGSCSKLQCLPWKYF